MLFDARQKKSSMLGRCVPPTHYGAMTPITRRCALAALAALPGACGSEAPAAQRFKGFDAARMAVRIAGDGRPTLLLHGFASNGEAWFRWGLAGRLVAQGRRVIAPDFRGHGGSDAPEGPDAYPKDVLAMDQEALLASLGLGAYDIVAYSMGALVAVRMLARGARPGRVVLGGMGDARIEGVTARDEMFRDAAAHGEAARTEGARRIAQMLAKGGLKGPAILGVLDSLERTPPVELKRLTTPILVVCGQEDDENGSAEGLAAALGNARAMRVPGAHGTTPQTNAFQKAVTGFLGRP